ncbi:hypothetical protein [Actinosynnema mirum]|uniref:Uncharacterized protein n=1 Tax=Actinosynnema mirum (strain ATCC 29888 / DSM 43827 / JCM 3225 / NBRC 14064 / NCIMB 13271 / NRRL B-12336 / IMRU 3971 / 101) TaxID=446462 RepID=C6WB25_ACTMD|nr:hypothetical protein [Actinosynnema mirum]ACU39316.1 hypothetical protein Amir_5498 [Actinosynnema mirum DSM 43827]
MLATIAAVIFGLALLLDLANASLGSVIEPATLTLAGLLFLALHMAGVGSALRAPSFRRRR